MSVAKPHRQNSGFQLRHFLAGSCSTPDGAYVLMYGQLIDMQGKLRHAESQLKTRQAKLKAAAAKEAHAKFTLEQRNFGCEIPEHEVLQAEADALQAEADRLEIEADIPTWDMNWQAAKQELADIETLMLELKPLCKHADLPILEMAEACQEEEWLGELKQRVENFLLTTGTIPHDHFQTMRMHPQFKAGLVPHIQLMNQKLGQAQMLMQQGKDGMTSLMLELEDGTKLLAAPQKED